MAKLLGTLNGTKHNRDKICQWNLVRSAEDLFLGWPWRLLELCLLPMGLFCCL